MDGVRDIHPAAVIRMIEMTFYAARQFRHIPSMTIMTREAAVIYRVPQTSSSSWTSWRDRLDMAPSELPHRYVQVSSTTI